METVAEPTEQGVVVRPDFDEWVAARGPSLLRLAYTLSGNAADAEDVVQDALSRALPRWSRIAAMTGVDAYVRRMVVNAHTSWWRRWRRRESPVETVHDVDLPVVADRVRVEHDERRRIWAACRALPEAQRTAVVLRYYEQLEYAEIAELTGCARVRCVRGSRGVSRPCSAAPPAPCDDRRGRRRARDRGARGGGVVTCGGHDDWTVATMDGGLSGVVDDAEVRAAFTDVLAEAPVDAPTAILEDGAEAAPYIVLADDGDSYTLGIGPWSIEGPGRAAMSAGLERQPDGSLRMTGWGDCQLTSELPQGRSLVEVSAPNGGVDPGTTSPVVMVSEVDCTSGRDPTPFLGEPTITEEGDRVLVSLTSGTLSEPANCIGNPLVPLTLSLDEPIGDRELLDSGTFPPTSIKVAPAPRAARTSGRPSATRVTRSTRAVAARCSSMCRQAGSQ